MLDFIGEFRFVDKCVDKLENGRVLLGSLGGDKVRIEFSGNFEVCILKEG